MAIRMAAASKAFRGDGWRAKFPTTREDLTAIFGYQETQMSPEDFRVFRAALEIVANPAELSAWQRRLGPVEIPSDRLQRMQERRQRFENWKLEYRELLRQHRERIREGGGNPQGSDRCGSAVVQDDADCELCDAECWEEADRRVAPLWMWQEDAAARRAESGRRVPQGLRAGDQGPPPQGRLGYRLQAVRFRPLLGARDERPIGRPSSRRCATAFFATRSWTRTNGGSA